MRVRRTLGLGMLLGGLFSIVAPVLGQSCDPSWEAIADLADEVWTTTVFDDGTGPALYAGGDFPTPGATQVVRWDGVAWIPVGSALDGRISVLEVLDRGLGPELFAGGLFTGNVAVWDGFDWVALPSPGGNVRDLVIYQGDLVAAGAFPRRVRRFDEGTQSWVDIGNGVQAMATAVIVHDDGGGEALYVGGLFDCAGTIGDCLQGAPDTVAIARWNGLAWSSVGGGALLDPVIDSRVLTLHVLDLGSGPQLVAGGRFDEMGGVPCANLAVWDGSTWSPLGSGIPGAVLDLAQFDDSTGPGIDLYACGSFLGRVRKWDGVQWSPLDEGLDLTARTMSVHDDGSAEAIYCGGDFSTAGTVPAAHIARWVGAEGPDSNGDGYPDACAMDAFIRGDANNDGLFDLADAIFALGFLFAVGNPVPSPECDDALDANDDGFITIADPVTQLNTLFMGPALLPQPFPLCGLDPTTDTIDCLGPVLNCP